MKFRVSGTPIAAALLRFFELDPKRGRAFLPAVPRCSRSPDSDFLFFR